MNLNKVNCIGEAYYNVFKSSDGSLFEVETTQEDYKQLGQLNPKNPTNLKGTWDQSYSILKFDTPDGRLRNGDYAEYAGYRIVKANDSYETALNATDMVGDTLKSDALEKVNNNKPYGDSI